jgi:hypothetical protein
MHSSLVVTTDGLPLGLAAIKFWTRDKFHGANALKRSINPTRVPIEQKESYRWLENVMQSTALLAEPERIVHIGDRESDIYELFSEAHRKRPILPLWHDVGMSATMWSWWMQRGWFRSVGFAGGVRWLRSAG